MEQSIQDARLVYDTLATRFLFASRRELREATGLDNMRLYRAILQCERQGLLLAEHRGKLAVIDNLYGLRKGGDIRH